MSIKTNELKKGDCVLLRNGWQAQIADNRKGNTREATVFGLYAETGSVYAHDITKKISHASKGGSYLVIEDIELTDAQKKLRRNLENGGW